ncbi:hypothetical protein HK103_004096, partial [Boothiomyces macroporosus]
MPKRFLNVEYNGVKAEIDVTDAERLGDVQLAVKTTFGNTFEKVDAPYLQLFQPLDSEEKQISDLDEIPDDFFKKLTKGGLSLFIRITPLSIQHGVQSVVNWQ